MYLHGFMYMCGKMTLKATKGFLDPLELELQTAVNYPLWGLWKSSKCSDLLSHHSSPPGLTRSLSWKHVQKPVCTLFCTAPVGPHSLCSQDN